MRLFTLADTKNGHKIRLTQFSHRTVMNYDFRPLFCKFSNGITKKSCLTVFNNYNPSRLLSVLYLSLTSKIRPSFGPISPLPTLQPNCRPAPPWPKQPKIRRPPYGFSTLLWTCLAGISLISVRRPGWPWTEPFHGKKLRNVFGAACLVGHSPNVRKFTPTYEIWRK